MLQSPTLNRLKRKYMDDLEDNYLEQKRYMSESMAQELGILSLSEENQMEGDPLEQHRRKMWRSSFNPFVRKRKLPDDDAEDSWGSTSSSSSTSSSPLGSPLPSMQGDDPQHFRQYGISGFRSTTRPSSPRSTTSWRQIHARKMEGEFGDFGQGNSSATEEGKQFQVTSYINLLSGDSSTSSQSPLAFQFACPPLPADDFKLPPLGDTSKALVLYKEPAIVVLESVVRNAQDMKDVDEEILVESHDMDADEERDATISSRSSYYGNNYSLLEEMEVQ